MAAIAQSIDNFLDKFFGEQTPSPSKPPNAKRANTGASNDKENSGLSSQDRRFMRDLFRGFGYEISGVLQQQSTKIDTMGKDVASHSNEIVAMKAQLEAQAKKIEEMERAGKLMNDSFRTMQVTQSALSESVSSSPIPTSQDGLFPPNQFTMGSLGRDLWREDAKKIAKEIIGTLGLSEPDDLFAPYAFGSQVVIVWNNRANFELCRLKLSQTEVMKEGANGRVWVDVRKTRKQLLPKKMLKAINEALMQENQRQGFGWQQVIRCGSSGQIFVDRRAIGRLNRSTLEWAWFENHPVPPNVVAMCDQLIKDLRK